MNLYDHKETHERRSTGPLALAMRRKGTLIVVSGICFVGLSFAIVNMKPLYTAEAMLVLPSAPSTDLTQRSNNSNISQTDPFLLKSLVDVVKSDEISRTVIKGLGLVSMDEFKAKPGLGSLLIGFVQERLLLKPRIAPIDGPAFARGAVLRLYKKRLDVTNDGHSLTVNIAFTSEDPNVAASVANEQARVFIEQQVSIRAREARAKTDWLKMQIAEAAKDVRSAQVSLQMSAPGDRRNFDAADHVADLKSRSATAIAKQGVYDSLLSRLMILEAEQGYVASDVRMVSAALPPTSPTFPNLPIAIGLASIVSLIMGLASAAAIAHLTKPVDIPAVLDRFGVKSLGSLRIASWMDILDWRSRGFKRACFWEEIRSFRADLGPKPKLGAVTTLTALEPRSGTTLVTASLGKAFAASGVRTVVVDLNVRKPDLHRFLGVKQHNDLGIEDALTEGKAASEFFVPAGFSGCLTLLTSSSGRDGNVDLVGGTNLNRLISQLRQEYEAVIIDTPPVGAVADALRALKVANNKILVAPRRDVARGRIAMAMQLLSDRSTPPTGIVLTYRGRLDRSPVAVGPYIKSDCLSSRNPFPAIDMRGLPVLDRIFPSVRRVSRVVKNAVSFPSQASV